jgi:hypothetical protein
MRDVFHEMQQRALDASGGGGSGGNGGGGLERRSMPAPRVFQLTENYRWAVTAGDAKRQLLFVSQRGGSAERWWLSLHEPASSTPMLAVP